MEKNCFQEDKWRDVPVNKQHTFVLLTDHKEVILERDNCIMLIKFIKELMLVYRMDVKRDIFVLFRL